MREPIIEPSPDFSDISAHGNIGVGAKISSHVLIKGVDNFLYDWRDSSRQKVEFSTRKERKTEAVQFTSTLIIFFVLGTGQKCFNCNQCAK